MNEYEQKLHQLKYEIRYAINKSGLNLSLIETVLEAVRAEILQIENTNLKEELIKASAESKPADEHTIIQEKGE